MEDGGFFIKVREPKIVSRRRRLGRIVPLRGSPPEEVDEVHETGADLKRLLSRDLPAEVVSVDRSELIELLVGELHLGMRVELVVC
jgi:hypothetical protein